MTPARSIAPLFVALAIAACSEDRPAEVAGERADPRGAPARPAPQDERAGDVTAPSDIAEPAPATPSALPDPEAGCAFGAPVRVHDAPGWPSIARLGPAFVVAGVARDGEGERAFVSRLDADGSLHPIASGAIEDGAPDHRRAAPALATTGSRVAIALADGRARLLFAALEGGGALSWRVLAEGASLRFSPALAPDGDAWAIGWTEEGEHAMRVRAGRIVAGELRGARDLRADAGGSAAPAFVAGASPPELVFLDPRAGVSVAHRASLTDAGFGDPAVARPINLVTEPPEIAAVRVGGAPWLAYTAVGSVATTAVGLVPLEGEAEPVAIVPGTGYGVLHVDAAPLSGDGAVFVADAPRAGPPDSPRELWVRVVGADGTLGDAAIVRGPGGAASRGRVAHLADGVVAVAFTDAHAIYAAVGRCAAP